MTDPIRSALESARARFHWIMGANAHMQDATPPNEYEQAMAGAASITAALASLDAPQGETSKLLDAHQQHYDTWKENHFRGVPKIGEEVLVPQPDALREAVEALEPFAEAAELLPDGYNPMWGIKDIGLALDAADLIRARSALARLKEGEAAKPAIDTGALSPDPGAVAMDAVETAYILIGEMERKRRRVPPYELYAQTDYAKVKPVFEKLKSARAAIAELEGGDATSKR